MGVPHYGVSNSGGVGKQAIFEKNLSQSPKW